MRFLLDDGLEGGPGGVVQPHDVPGEGQHLPPVVLGDLSPDLLLHTRLDLVAAEEVAVGAVHARVGRRPGRCGQLHALALADNPEVIG